MFFFVQIPNLPFCVIICLYLPCITAAASFSVLRRLGGFTSRNRKKRFNSWNTQLCLWFTVAAFHSSTAAERTHSILGMKKSIFYINNYCHLNWKPTNQPYQPHGTPVIYNLLQFNMTASYYLVKKLWLFFPFEKNLNLILRCLSFRSTQIKNYVFFLSLLWKNDSCCHS